jgi:predicted nuclease of predicted toxin-antitoxin system
MKICVDENIPRVTVTALSDLGHDVLDIRGTPSQGIADDTLWNLVQAHGRLLITTDKGFTQYRAVSHHGLLIVRLHQPNEQKIHDRVLQAIDKFPAEDWPGLMVVMRDTVQSISRAS